MLGRPSELLYGPLQYGWIFVISACYYWGDSPLGITSLMLLCAGDGFAGTFTFLIPYSMLYSNLLDGNGVSLFE